MTRFLNRASFSVHLSIIALLFATSFIIERSLFNGLIEGKLLGVELMALPIIVFLVVVMPFTRQIRFSAIDGGVLLFTAWYLVRELLSSSPTFQTIEKSAFHGCFGSSFTFLCAWGLQTVALYGVLSRYGLGRFLCSQVSG
jgi:hypothetical protein